MIAFEAAYDCRLCGEVFTQGPIEDSKEIAALLVAQHSHYTSARLKIPHHCGNGSVGLADFIGMSAKEEVK